MAERVAIILPALNEEAAIGGTLAGLAGHAAEQIIVVDNGSTDRTAELARAAGAEIVRETRRGYSRACLAGIAALRREISVAVFLDADGSDDPRDLPRLLDPIERGEADLVLGSRLRGERERGALTPQQHLGNVIATRMLQLLVGAKHTDLGPFRAIRREALDHLDMPDTGFGRTIEMQIKAHQKRLRTVEIPVHYRRRRGGASKVSGNPVSAVKASGKIMWTILRNAF